MKQKYVNSRSIGQRKERLIITKCQKGITGKCDIYATLLKVSRSFPDGASLFQMERREGAKHRSWRLKHNWCLWRTYKWLGTPGAGNT